MNAWESALTIAGLCVITLVTRGFFILPRRRPPMPGWLLDGLRHAPVAALVAVVVPDILLTQGQLPHSWRDPKLAGTAAALLWLVWRRGDMLGTIVAGTATLLICRLALGW